MVKVVKRCHRAAVRCAKWHPRANARARRAALATRRHRDLSAVCAVRTQKLRTGLSATRTDLQTPAVLRSSKHEKGRSVSRRKRRRWRTKSHDTCHSKSVTAFTVPRATPTGYLFVNRPQPIPMPASDPSAVLCSGFPCPSAAAAAQASLGNTRSRHVNGFDVRPVVVQVVSVR